MALRLTRDYHNQNRDRRRSSGFHSFKLFPANSFIVWWPAHSRMSSSGKLIEWNARMSIYTDDDLYEIPVPYERVKDFLPDHPGAITERIEAGTVAQKLAMNEFDDRMVLYILKYLHKMGKFSPEDIDTACAAQRAIWDAEDET